MKLITGVLILGNAITHPLKESVESYIPYVDELLVYDGSTDGSIEVVRPYATRVIKESPGGPDFAKFRNECLDAIETEWAFFFFTDEILEIRGFTPEGFREVLKATKEDSYAIPRWNEPNGADYPDFQANIVRKSSGARYHRKIHEVLVHPPKKFLGPVMEVRHKVKTREELDRRDKRWMEIDPATERVHRARRDIQERLAAERKASKSV